MPAPSPARALHVALLSEAFYPIVGGAETHSRILAAELVQLGVRVTCSGSARRAFMACRRRARGARGGAVVSRSVVARLRGLAPVAELAGDLALGRYPRFIYGEALRSDELPVFTLQGAEPASFAAMLEFLAAKAAASRAAG